MASSVIYGDLVLFLTGWYRAALAGRLEDVCRDVVVTNTEPDVSLPFPTRMLIIAADLNRVSVANDEADVRLSILAGTALTPQDAVDLSLIVRALGERIAAVEPGNPVAALLGAAGPFVADENQDRSRRLVTLTLSVTGQPF